MIKRLMIVIIGLFLVATPAFATNGLLNNLQAYYELEETGLNYADQTGSWAITQSQTSDPPARTTGILNFGQAFRKSTTDDLVVPHNLFYNNINADGNMTISAWIKGTSTGTNQIFGAFAGSSSAGGTAGGINFFVENSKVTIGGNDCAFGGSWYNTQIGSAINNNAWHHVMISYSDYNTQNVWIDGSYAGTSSNPYCLPSSASSSANNGASSTFQKFGSNPANGGHPGQWSDYDMDEVAFWNTTLNSTHATALYNNGSALAYSSFDTGVPPNTPPTITPIADQSMNEDTTLNVPSAFNIFDAEDPISSLTLSYSGYNTSLLNTTSISFDVNTTTGVVDMAITPLPDAYGVTNVTINVTDTSAGTASDTFLLTIFNVNDAPTITAISSPQINTESNTLVINFNVTDIDNPYTDLTYTFGAEDYSIIPVSGSTFSYYNGTNQTFTLVAPAEYGKTLVNVSVKDLQPAIASTIFDYIVNCNTTTRYYSPMNVTKQEFVGSTTPTTCFEQSFTYNTITDILTYTWHDFGQTMNNIKFWAYDTTGNFRIPLNETTLTGNNGTLTIDYSAVNPNYNILAIADLTDNTRSFYTGSGVSSTARILDVNVDQAGQLGSLFSVSDGIVYGVLILLLFLTLGIASQSASLTLIFSILGLFIASKFVLRIPSQFIWITGALVVILLYLIAKLRTD